MTTHNNTAIIQHNTAVKQNATRHTSELLFLCGLAHNNNKHFTIRDSHVPQESFQNKHFKRFVFEFQMTWSSSSTSTPEGMAPAAKHPFAGSWAMRSSTGLAEQSRAGQGRAEQSRAGQGRVGQGRGHDCTHVCTHVYAQMRSTAQGVWAAEPMAY